MSSGSTCLYYHASYFKTGLRAETGDLTDSTLTPAHTTAYQVCLFCISFKALVIPRMKQMGTWWNALRGKCPYQVSSFAFNYCYKHHSQKGLGEGRVYFTLQILGHTSISGGSQGRNSRGTWRQELVQSLWGHTTYCHAPYGLLSLLLYSTKD